jgi:orotidine-5'-phosphate decarboxylase
VSAIDRRAPVAVALDTNDLDTALRWSGAVGPHVTTLKVGLQLFLRHGARAVREVRAASGCAIFLDLKLHDIPNTVAGAARSVADLDPAFVTVHASGGAAMIAAAAAALPAGRVAAVTVLTSLTRDDLDTVGLAGPPVDAAVRLGRLAVHAGAAALVCSPLEVAAVRLAVGPGVTLITPGVRLGTDPAHDQARVTGAERALADGADLLVVGRPITSAPEPGVAAREFAAALGGAPVG